MKFLTWVSLCAIIFLADCKSQECTQSNALTIVVLGSSTAAGSGASTSDSAWVNRYRNHLETLNPSNQVINLAIGGYTTYKIMPDGFIPLPNRPAVNTTHNITHAFTHNPDAIIINLPSNDRQWPKEEQLANFDSLWNHSWNHGVPIWICTTQPINSSQTINDYQAEVKDSIVSIYGNFAMDFWNPLALPNNAINPIYASDAVHLNDLGHRMVFQSAVTADIPTALSQLILVDYASWGWDMSGIGQCASPSSALGLIIGNCGISDTSVFTAGLIITNDSSNTVLTHISLTGLSNSEFDTMYFQFPMEMTGSYHFTGFVYSPEGVPEQNDTIAFDLTIQNTPSIQVTGDTNCTGNYLLQAISDDSGSNLFWYSSLTDSLPIDSANTFITGAISQSQSYYVESVSPDFSISNLIPTTSGLNKWWNGYMFDVVAFRSVVIDSLTVNIADAGMQTLNVYTKTGTYKGHELTSSSWTLLGQYTVNVTTNDQYVVFDIDDVIIPGSQTTGFYIHMDNSSSRLTYYSNGLESVRTTDEIELTTGSGISYNFSQIYFPRDWNGTVHYHYDLPGCRSPKAEVRAVMTPSEEILVETQNISPSSALLSWQNNEVIDHFKIRGRKVGNVNWIWLQIPGTDSSKQVFGLSANQFYEWQIRGYCKAGNGEAGSWSHLDTFETICTMPDTSFTLIVSSTGARLEWLAESGAATWEIKGSRVGNNSWATITVAGNQFSKDVFGLIPATAYEWTIRKWCEANGNNVSDWRPLVSFSTNSGNRWSSDEPYFDVKINCCQSNSIAIQFLKAIDTTVDFEIYSAEGKKLVAYKNFESNQLSISKNKLTNGIYFIRILSPVHRLIQLPVF